MAVLSLSTNCCRVCNVDKPIGEFYIVKGGHGGRYAENTCKACRIQKNNATARRPERVGLFREWRRQHKAKLRRAKGCRLRADMTAEAARKRAENQVNPPPQHDAHVRRWRQVMRWRERYRRNAADPEYVSKRNAQRRANMKAKPEARAKAVAYTKQWMKTSKGRELAKRMRKAYDRTPKGVIDSRMKRAIRDALKGGKGGVSWQKLVGYSLTELKQHLERQFVKGMGWHNRQAWHIDHIVPKSLFKYETADDPEFKACWALTNLRPLWAKANTDKSAARTHLL